MAMISIWKCFFISVLKILLVTADQNYKVSPRTLISNDSKDICSLSLNIGHSTRGRHYIPRWYYDRWTNKCQFFYYNGCCGNANNFNDSQTCEKLCVKKDPKDICGQPKHTGDCWFGYGRWWFYDKLNNDCKSFWYSGCGGNDNRFENKLACTLLCFKNETTENDLQLTKGKTDYNGFNVYPYKKNLNSKINTNPVSRSSFEVPAYKSSKTIKFGSIFGVISFSSFIAGCKICKCWRSKQEKESPRDNGQMERI